MVESADRKTTIAARESDSDRELVVVARRGEAQAHERTLQIEQNAESMLTQLGGALRSTEEGQAVSVAEIKQRLDGHYQQREERMRQSLQSQMANTIAQLEHECRAQVLAAQQQVVEAHATNEQPYNGRSTTPKPRQTRPKPGRTS